MDRPLFVIAPSRVTVVATYDWRFGWSARLSVPAAGDQGALVDVYGPLSAPELVDAVSSALVALLGLGD